METPNDVLNAAAGLVSLYGPEFSLLGNKDGWDVYHFDFPKGRYTGYPFLFLYKEGHKVKEVTGPKALELILFFDVE